MITYNNIVTKFEEFVGAHFFLKTFSHGSPSDVDLDKDETYPLLHLVYVGGGYVDNVKTYNLEVYILDNPPRDTDKTGFQKSVISATEQAAEDILADIENGGNIFTFGYHYDLQSANIVPLEDERSNVLAGTLLTLSIGVAYQYDSCNAPLSGVEPEGSVPQPFVTRGLLRVREVDGTPDVTSVATMVVPNGSLTDDGNGTITLDFGAGAVSAVTATAPLSSTGGTTPDISLNVSGVTAGSYTAANITIDSFGRITDATSGAVADATRIIVTAKNVSGGTLAKGTPVHAVTPISAGQQVEVIAARADTPSAMPATLVLNEQLLDDEEGEAIVVGLIQNVDTSAFTAGDVIYVGPTGGYTNTKPTGTNLIQNLGIVVKSHLSSGSGIVYGSGRSNDVPNIPNGQTWIGNASGVATPTALAAVATAGTAISLTDINSVGSGEIITAAERTKLTGIEAGAEVNPTSSEVKTLYESNADTNAFTDAEQTKLAGIEAGAEVNPDASEVKTLYESNADTNAFTDAEKTKLGGIAAGAEVNVNADWNATTGDAQILNKPTIPAAQVNSDWDSTSGVSEILNKPTLVENIGDLGDVTETALTAGQLLYYDGAGWINKTVVGGSAVASVIWTGNTTTSNIGTYPTSYTSAKYSSAATVTPAGSFSILYNSTLNSLQVSGLSTGTSIAFTAKFGVTPAVVNDFIDVRLRAFFSNSPVFTDTSNIANQLSVGLPVEVETEVLVSSTITVGSHPTVDIFLETAGLYSAGTARCIDFEITFT
jgi:hypothetical protein